MYFGLHGPSIETFIYIHSESFKQRHCIHRVPLTCLARSDSTND